MKVINENCSGCNQPLPVIGNVYCEDCKVKSLTVPQKLAADHHVLFDCTNCGKEYMQRVAPGCCPDCDQEYEELRDWLMFYLRIEYTSLLTTSVADSVVSYIQSRWNLIPKQQDNEQQS